MKTAGVTYTTPCLFPSRSEENSQSRFSTIHVLSLNPQTEGRTRVLGRRNSEKDWRKGDIRLRGSYQPVQHLTC